jgi:hypothetical protein
VKAAQTLLCQGLQLLRIASLSLAPRFLLQLIDAKEYS